MQTKFTYRVLKWTLLTGVIASLATACVVTTGDDVDIDDGDAGSGNSSQAGESTSGGKTSTAGTSGAGGKGGSAGTGTGGTGGSTTAGSSAGGEGGSASDYTPGLCESEAPTPSSVPSCALNEDDMTTETCRKCLKSNCCEEWQTCYGDTPSTACGWGSTESAPGQFECIRACYLADMTGDDAAEILGRCEASCLDQCEDDGFADTPTQDLLTCGQGSCLADCFTP